MRVCFTPANNPIASLLNAIPEPLSCCQGVNTSVTALETPVNAPFAVSIAVPNAPVEPLKIPAPPEDGEDMGFDLPDILPDSRSPRPFNKSRISSLVISTIK